MYGPKSIPQFAKTFLTTASDVLHAIPVFNSRESA
jgi:hypothetical protein